MGNDFMSALSGIMQQQGIEITKPAMSPEEYAQLRCDWYNKTVGKLTGVNCDKCLNKGYIAKINSEGVEVHEECECMKIRDNIKAMEKSGLNGLLDRYTFNGYEVTSDWQKRMKAACEIYAQHSADEWLFLSGVSGSGKTHLCTAVCKYLISEGHEVKYLLWFDIVHRLEGLRYKYEDRQAYISEISNAEILYIDDFLKSPKDTDGVSKQPNATELRYAYEILNNRYNGNKKTILSTEWQLQEINGFDTAVAGRIKERSAKFVIQVQRGEDRNYRMKTSQAS